VCNSGQVFPDHSSLGTFRLIILPGASVGYQKQLSINMTTSQALKNHGSLQPVLASMTVSGLN